MRKRSVSVWVLALVLAVSACSPAAPAAKQKLVLAIQPTLAATEMLEKAKPLEQYLEQRLGGVDVEIYVPLSQAGVIEAIRFGQADLALLSAWPAYLAVEKAGAELALAEVREVLIDGTKTEQTYYFSYWVVPKESAYQSLSELRSRRACFPSAVSTSGYVAPLGRLIELGLVVKPAQGEADARTFFKDVVFGGGYSQCWEALKAGQVDVTIIAGDVPEKLYRDVLASTRVLEKQGPIPSHGLVVSQGLAEPLRSRAIEAMMGLGAPEYRDLMRSFVSSIFVGFQRTRAEEHLATLKGYLNRAGLVFTERIAP